MSCPSSYARRTGASKFFRQAREQLQRDQQVEDCEQIEAPEANAETEEPERRTTPEFEFDTDEIVGVWPRAGGLATRGQASARAASLGGTRIRSRAPAASGCCWRPSGWTLILSAERAGNEAYQAYRAQGRMRDGGGGSDARPIPTTPPEVPAGKVNATDPDSRPIPVGFGFCAGLQRPDRGQRATDCARGRDHEPIDHISQLAPMVDATLRELEQAGIDQLPEAVAADAGYWNEQQMDGRVRQAHPGAGRSGQGQPWHTQTLAGASTSELDADRARL